MFCAASLSNISGFYTEIMKGLGASTRLFELQNQVSKIPLTGGKVIKDVSFCVVFCYNILEKCSFISNYLKYDFFLTFNYLI